MYIIYEIPIYSEYIGYNCDECINFLKNNLEKEKLNVKKISSKKINIDWHDLEKKINNVNQISNTNPKEIFNNWK